MDSGFDMAHVLAAIAKWIAVLVVFGFSVGLSFSFFQSIAPASLPAFPYEGLGLTEGGFALWMIVFRLGRHHPFRKSIALIMVGLCAICCVIIAVYEFNALISAHYDVSQVAGLLNFVRTCLLALFAAHIIAFCVEMIGNYFLEPGHPFIGNGGSLQSQYRVTEERSERPQPKEAERTLEQRSTRQLPPARQGPGFWQNFISKFQKQESSVAALPPAVSNSNEADEEARIRQEIRQEREEQERQQRLAAIRSRIIAEEHQQKRVSVDEPETPVQQPDPVDRKAEAEQQSKSKK